MIELGLVDTRMTRGDLGEEDFAKLEAQVPESGKAFTTEQAAVAIVELLTSDKNREVVVFDGGISEALRKA